MASPNAPMGFGAALEKLKKVANLEPVRKDIHLSDGVTTLTMYVTPLVAAERDRARANAKKASKSDDDSNWLMHLVVLKAKDEDGNPMFTSGEIEELKREVRDEDLQKLQLAVLGSDDDSIETSSKKSQTNSGKTAGPT